MEAENIIKILPDGKVVLGGYVIPHIDASDQGEGEVKYWINLDNRFGFYFSNKTDFEQAVYLMANAMAVACGFSSFGKHCHPIGKFNQYVGGEGEFGNFHLPGTAVDFSAKAEKAY
jgi:hypothetical protein